MRVYFDGEFQTNTCSILRIHPNQIGKLARNIIVISLLLELNNNVMIAPAEFELIFLGRCSIPSAMNQYSLFDLYRITTRVNNSPFLNLIMGRTLIDELFKINQQSCAIYNIEMFHSSENVGVVFLLWNLRNVLKSSSIAHRSS